MKHRPKPTKKSYQLIHPLAPVTRGFCIVHVQCAEKNFHFFFEIRGNQKKIRCLLLHVSRDTRSSESAKANEHAQSAAGPVENGSSGTGEVPIVTAKIYWEFR